ncbi:MAG: hypothetical protein K1X94_15550 [Sandaracinaceae bacterium]|nr:hypothetical protein [Sandaracinaceae bacterium]
MLGPARPASMGIRRALLVSAIALAHGCGTSTALDAGSDAALASDAPTIPHRMLTVVGPTSLTIEPLAERTLRFSVADDLGAVSGADVQFVLEGMVRSSTLRQLEGTTDGMGQVSVVLVAGPQPTTFRVRATTPGAAPATVDVSVGNEFGELVVTLDATVSRHVASYVVRAVADVPCAELPPSAGGDERTLGVELATTSFSALSTAASWTVEARGKTAAGIVVAQGCVEGLHVASTVPTPATLPVRDLPLDEHGAYAFAWTLAAEAVAREAQSTTLDAAVGETGATLLLDGLAGALARTSASDLDLLVRARGGALDERLAAELASTRSGLPSVLAPLADEVNAGFATLTFEATLRRADLITLSPVQARVGLDLLDPTWASGLAALRPVVGRDELTLEGLEVRVGPATLWSAALAARGLAHSADGLPGLVRDSASCGTLVTVASRESLLATCDAHCIREGCAEAGVLLAERALALGRDLDARAAVLRFDGTLTMLDDDDDLRADRLAGVGESRWQSVDATTATSLVTSIDALRDDTLE